VLKLRQDIQTVFGILDNKLGVLKGIFADIVKTHAHKELVFGIDSFRFQNRLIETDYKNLSSIFRDIDNRIYCEYYNLYTEISKYGKKEIREEKLKNSPNFTYVFKPYRHLDTSTVYSIDVIKTMQEAVSGCLTDLEAYHSTKQAELNLDEEQSRLGLNIDNLVYTEMYRNAMLKARIDMFYKYLSVFFDHHNKYYTRLLLKAKLHLGIVNEDILIKQFNQQTTTAGLSELADVKSATSPAAQMNENDASTVKSYIQYEEMSGTRKDVLDNIIASCGSGSSSDGSDRDSPIDSSIENNTEETVPIIAASSNDNDIFVHESKDTSAITFNEEDVHEIIEDNANSNNSPTEQGIVLTIDEAEENIPEESEMASIAGEASNPYSEDDIGKQVFVEGYDSIGNISFVGQHHHDNKPRVGVTLKEPIGRNNGTVRGHKYFECAEKYGVLVVPHKVHIHEDSLS